MVRRVLSSLACALVLASPARAWAEPTEQERAAAVALFDEARQLMEQKEYPAACAKLEQARRLAQGLGILFHLADCYEKVGRTASAWVGFREVASLARSSDQEGRATDAQDRANALEPNLIKLVIVVAESVPSLRVTSNGKGVAAELWGTSAPIDPGRYTIVAEAPGHERWETVVTAEQPGELRVEIPALAPLASAEPVKRTPEPAPDDGAAPDWQTPVGIAAFVTGGVAVLAAGGLAIAAKVKADGADCDDEDLCSMEGVDTRADAVTMGNVATVIMIAGGVIGAAGLVIWLTAPSDEIPAALQLTPTGATLRLHL